jgi:hypothetical protein
MTRTLMRLSPKHLRKLSPDQLLNHVESRMGTLCKRSIGAYNNRSEVVGRDKVDISTLNPETLVYLADVLNRVERA